VSVALISLLALTIATIPLVHAARKARVRRPTYEKEGVDAVAKAGERRRLMPGDLVVFDWRGPYLAEGIVHGSSKSDWVEVMPGDSGLLVTVEPKGEKPYVVLLGRQNRLVRLSKAMVKKSPSLVPPALFA
jgi:hypothetical protein